MRTYSSLVKGWLDLLGAVERGAVLKLAMTGASRESLYTWAPGDVAQ